MKRVRIWGWRLFFLLLLVCFSPIKWPANPLWMWLDCDRVVVRLLVTTGPDFGVLEGESLIRDQVMALSDQPVSDLVEYDSLHLQGDTPGKYLNLAYTWQTDWVLTGRVIGLSEAYRDLSMGPVPIFEATDCRPTHYVPRLLHSPHFSMTILLIAVPLLFLVLCVLTLAEMVMRRIKKPI